MSDVGLYQFKLFIIRPWLLWRKTPEASLKIANYQKVFNFLKPLHTLHAYCVCEVYGGWFYGYFSENLAKLQEINRTRDRRFHIVTPLWIAESIEAEKLLKEREFPLRIQLWHSEYWYNTYNIHIHIYLQYPGMTDLGYYVHFWRHFLIFFY